MPSALSTLPSNEKLEVGASRFEWAFPPLGAPAYSTPTAPGMQPAVHGFRYTGSSTARRDEHGHLSGASPYRGGRVSGCVAPIGEFEQAKIREFVADDV